MELANYYNLLKIKPTADLDTIKKAFRTEIALYHPDNNKAEGARAHFDLLVEAFDMLSDPKKRKIYNEMLYRQHTQSEIVVQDDKELDYQKYQYTEWQKEAKTKSDSYWKKDLSDLFLLDIFAEVGMNTLFFGLDSLLDGLGDSLEGIGDIFDF